jgi:hypothetical protein
MIHGNPWLRGAAAEGGQCALARACGRCSRAEGRPCRSCLPGTQELEACPRSYGRRLGFVPPHAAPLHCRAAPSPVGKVMRRCGRRDAECRSRLGPSLHAVHLRSHNPALSSAAVNGASRAQLFLGEESLFPGGRSQAQVAGVTVAKTAQAWQCKNTWRPPLRCLLDLTVLSVHRPAGFLY